MRITKKTEYGDVEVFASLDGTTVQVTFQSLGCVVNGIPVRYNMFYSCPVFVIEDQFTWQEAQFGSILRIDKTPHQDATLSQKKKLQLLFWNLLTDFIPGLWGEIMEEAKKNEISRLQVEISELEANISELQAKLNEINESPALVLAEATSTKRVSKRT